MIGLKRKIFRSVSPQILYGEKMEDEQPDICDDSKIDTIFTSSDGHVYVFKGETLTRFCLVEEVTNMRILMLRKSAQLELYFEERVILIYVENRGLRKPRK